MRLTKDLKTPHDDTTYADDLINVVDRENIVLTKLKHYEDLEEELGIDLITLFELIKAKNVYSYGHTSIMKNSGEVDIYDKSIKIWNGICSIKYPLSDYGKSFALTKEELL